MIQSFKPKGLEDFFCTGLKKGIQPDHAKKLRLVLDRLPNAELIGNMDYPGLNLQPLHGDLKGDWAVNASGNWRVTFQFENGNAYIVDY